MQLLVHAFLHLCFPLFIALVFFRNEWRRAYLILLATMLVDLDHLFISPIFQADRCSFQFHYLHTYEAMVVYFLLLFLRKPFKIIGVGLLFHMLTDLIDCLFMYYNCKTCFADAPAIEVLEAVSNVLGF